ncbi:hypothetical protein HOK51_06465 [Candidatus Woesearchaeota archaeon]|nr:hypothetical protein [Candidatus Woesearchaeota archaeon]MBT6519467.1 hypothetical protein [Candidatus Woesearchaeota archaeon]MBT7368215.1 hypothetical protein [Candidatus Woesearchaeota archaeon]
MTVHHVITQRNLKTICPYCKQDLPSGIWGNSFPSTQDYKTIECKCGKKIQVNKESIETKIKHFQTKELM